MKLTILGCMGAYPSHNQATSSYLIESNGLSFVLDVGSGSFIHLAKIMEPTSIDAVLLTHYHHDHMADLGVLQYAFQLKPLIENLPKRELTIYGHNESNEFERLTMPNVSKGIAYNPSEVLSIGPFEITFLKTIHPVPCYAVRVRETDTNKVLVFTADSGYLESFIPFAKDADLLLADGMFLNGAENSLTHMTAGEVGKIANLAHVKQLILTHLPVYHWDTLLNQAKEQAGDVRVYLAKDFDSYVL